MTMCSVLFFFFFQAEDGIRDPLVTGVQTCALPICQWPRVTLAGSALARSTRRTTSSLAGTVREGPRQPKTRDEAGDPAAAAAGRPAPATAALARPGTGSRPRRPLARRPTSPGPGFVRGLLLAGHQRIVSTATGIMRAWPNQV